MHIMPVDHKRVFDKKIGASTDACEKKEDWIDSYRTTIGMLRFLACHKL